MRRVVQASESYSGPLPRPDDFAQFERVHPGAADRILKMAEEQAAHRQKMERLELELLAKHNQAVLKITRQDQRHRQDVITRGQNFALVIAVSGIIAGGLSLWLLDGWPAAVSGTAISGFAIYRLTRAFLTNGSADDVSEEDFEEPTRENLPRK